MHFPVPFHKKTVHISQTSLLESMCLQRCDDECYMASSAVPIKPSFITVLLHVGCCKCFGTKDEDDNLTD